ncbi:RING finger protein 10 [Scaptodrosophila lebanonensis]|uniref:E3 ubiquitin-protein ligase RNF10 n=1 Tax=Drosophila lebanonensis TaxID=7225 RepID=A0A6J2UE13_DROLE|nr:RING finger protein 10 [Scaptodrosophila lebanonensis]
MDSNKKQQQQSHHARSTKSCAPAEANRKSSELYANKSRHSRRREQIPTPRNEQQQQQQQTGKLRPNVDKRPRARGGGNYQGQGGSGNGYADELSSSGGAACTGDDNADGSAGLAASGVNYSRGSYDYGSKKQNLNHLLNFHCVPRESSDFGTGHGIRTHYHHHNHQGGASRKMPRYNKEQFLQANFQFVIRAGAKAQVNGSPDTLIDWNFIEQINIQTTEEPQCPICLYPPVAAQLTRCGHAYCWPCLLHYLSLSDKSWRKCPICYDAIHASDLKSCTIEQQRAMNVNDRITFQLMQRRKGSMYIEHYSGAAMLETQERFPLLSSYNEVKRYSKFLIAKRPDIAAIIERERRELLAESDESCPEHIFIQQALLTLNERRDKLGLALPEPKEEEEEVEGKPEKELEKDLPKTVSDTNSADNENDEDASVCSGDASSSTGTVTGTLSNSKFYYFYQSSDGQNIYLHPLNVKMLQACYGTLDQAPLLIDAQILQKEHHSMDEDHRRKFTCLGHLPLTCQFAVVEVDLQPPIVPCSILKLFKEDLLHRKLERQRRHREELKREQHINDLNDRQMGKLIASAANLDLSSAHEFPTCGFDEALPPLGSAYPVPISHDKGTHYASVAVAANSPKKEELWPELTSTGSRKSPPEFNIGAWGRAVPPTKTATPAASATVAQRAAANADSELTDVGHFALGDVLVGALDRQQKAQQRSGGAGGAKSNATSGADGNNKKQKKAKPKKMVPLFAVGMNRAP